MVESIGARRNPVAAFARNNRIIDERYRDLWDEMREQVWTC